MNIEYPICNNRIELERLLKEDREIPEELRTCLKCPGRIELSQQARMCTGYHSVDAVGTMKEDERVNKGLWSGIGSLEE